MFKVKRLNSHKRFDINKSSVVTQISNSLERQTADQQKHPCIIQSDSIKKILWDVYIMVLLLFTAVVLPYQIAYVEEDTTEWLVIYYFIDMMFTCDIVLSFLTSYKDNYKQTIVTSHKLIALNYLKGWFWIDTLSVFPFSEILGLIDEGENNLMRVARIGKMYKLVRLFRLVKILKLIKSNKKVVQHFSEKMKISNGCERLIFFVFFFVIFLHVFACLSVMVTLIQED